MTDLHVEAACAQLHPAFFRTSCTLGKLWKRSSGAMPAEVRGQFHILMMTIRQHFIPEAGQAGPRLRQARPEVEVFASKLAKVAVKAEADWCHARPVAVVRLSDHLPRLVAMRADAAPFVPARHDHFVFEMDNSGGDDRSAHAGAQGGDQDRRDPNSEQKESTQHSEGLKVKDDNGMDISDGDDGSAHAGAQGGGRDRPDPNSEKKESTQHSEDLRVQNDNEKDISGGDDGSAHSGGHGGDRDRADPNSEYHDYTKHSANGDDKSSSSASGGGRDRPDLNCGYVYSQYVAGAEAMYKCDYRSKKPRDFFSEALNGFEQRYAARRRRLRRKQRG